MEQAGGRTARAVAALLVALVLTGCAAATAPPDPTAAVSRAQADLSRAALDSLDGRSCPTLAVTTALEGLPDDVLPCLGQGEPRAVSAGDGRPSVVNLWASWCAPCVREMPLLQQTAARAGDGVRFVGIATQDSRDSAAGLLQATGVTYPSYDDPDGVVRSALRAVGLPVTVVLDARGRQVARKSGEVDAAWLDDALRAAGAALPPAG